MPKLPCRPVSGILALPGCCRGHTGLFVKLSLFQLPRRDNFLYTAVEYTSVRVYIYIYIYIYIYFACAKSDTMHRFECFFRFL